MKNRQDVFFVARPEGEFSAMVAPFADFLEEDRSNALLKMCREIDEEVYQEAGTKLQVFSLDPEDLAEPIRELVDGSYSGEHYDRLLIRFFLNTELGPHPHRVDQDNVIPFFLRRGFIDPERIQRKNTLDYKQYDLTIDGSAIIPADEVKPDTV